MQTVLKRSTQFYLMYSMNFQKLEYSQKYLNMFARKLLKKDSLCKTLRTFFGLRLSNGITKRQHLECVTWTKQRHFVNLAGVTLEESNRGVPCIDALIC